jgi:hypothetical protein
LLARCSASPSIRSASVAYHIQSSTLVALTIT